MTDERLARFGSGRSLYLADQLDRHGICLEQRNGETVLLDPLGTRVGIKPTVQALVGGLVMLIGLGMLGQAITGTRPGWTGLLLRGLFFVLGPIALLGGIGIIRRMILQLQATRRAEPAELRVSPYPLHPGDWVTVTFSRRFKTPSGSNPGKVSAMAFGLDVQKDTTDETSTYRASPFWIENLPDKDLPSGLMQVEHTWQFCLPPDAVPTIEEKTGYGRHWVAWGVDVRIEIKGFLSSESAFFFRVEP
ncbi:hypothetical protein HPC62_13275 [Thermoleptolyngbya sichuanensis A183]|uniref:Uncharacterized protein n=1 Tax=Thermoleptolyngbya sichuanensis A183 TaxID=2737172 RepID=A0A6M8BFF4_9CYAN|nr:MULTISPECIES: hypothetical protein [Thermoleptolyngbya]QKD83036.1 hypothetical protein HPC62_13275 [Thermoleptolyngbya sichuanensis A183]